jgi:DNA repair protein RadC
MAARKVKQEESAVYSFNAAANEDEIIAKALAIISGRIVTGKISLSNPKAVKEFLTLKTANEEREVFSVVWLDSQNKTLAHEVLSTGTINQASVYPREVVKAALKINAAAAIFSHNHPSGVASPSSADISLTNELKKALALVDVRVLDHIIIGGVNSYSFAEHGDI